MGEAETERSGLKWCSASQIESTPCFSASITWLKDSSKASGWVHAASDMKVDENPEIHMFLTGAYPSGKALACHIRMANT